ncbi:putative nuclease HARBI1 [Hydractinia symbiolongicarpus]|uniref:putative nuclease HARBI1 n=1 Tax=Hydractinia symbiolongicarpus TaxID=13093 RepID=UPI00254E9710|nr:putative nuclease HARBI1 [Hydractinia symbiolongicarpus]
MATSKTYAMKNFSMLISFFLSSLGSLVAVFTRNVEYLLSLRRQQQRHLFNAVEDHNAVLRKMQNLKHRVNKRRKRRRWINPGRTDLWWQNLYSGALLEQEWCQNLRMDYPTFMNLVDKIRVEVEPAHNSFRIDTLSAEKRTAMVLYYLKDQGSLRMTCNTFGVSLATLSKSLRSVCGAINDILGPELIKFPRTEAELKHAATLFESKFGFPQAIGCVDGTHIPIKRPTENAQEYFCYKMKYSLNCQAICDEKGCFIDVEVKWPGSVHDARVFANSSVSKMLVNNRLPPCLQELLPGYTPVPPLLIGDPAYPLLPNVMKEFNSCSSSKELIFNNHLRRARNQIECAFGRLKARWRILNRCLDVELDFAMNIIYSCFVLHNYCEINKVDVHPDLLQVQMMNEERCQNCEHHNQVYRLYTYNSHRGKAVRDSVMEYLHDKMEN